MTGPATAAMLGHRIREARAALGWPQSRLGEALGVTGTAVSYWESGRRPITAVDLCALASVLGVEPASLLPTLAGAVSSTLLPATSPVPWRTGQRVFRTLYSGGLYPAGRLIGVMDTAADARLVVAAVNAYTPPVVPGSQDRGV